MAAFVVAIDGPAGSGKSSVSREVAKRLGFGYLDTGAGYRAFALHYAANQGMPIEQLIEAFDYEISTDPRHQVVLLAGKDVSEDIRSDRATASVSAIARNFEVRELQRQDALNRIKNCENEGIVVEGRDTTTVVAPDAKVRILLTASEAVRLKRRGLEASESADSLISRDASDSKVVEFFNPAPGVQLVDTSELDFEQSVQAVLELVKAVQNG